MRARKRVLRWDFLAQPAQCMHPADARSSAARRVVVLPAQVTLARGLESDPPVVPAMSSLVGLRRCTLAGIAIQAASGAAKHLRAAFFACSHLLARASQALVGSWQESRHGGQPQAASLERVEFWSTNAQKSPSVGC